MSRAPVSLILFLARKGLAENRLITALLVLAVICGVAFQVANTANLQGYNAELVEQAVDRGYGQLRLLPAKGQRFEVNDELRHKLAGEPEVVAAVPILVLAGAVGRDGAFRNAAVIGVDLAVPRQPYRITEGKPLAPGDDQGVLLGLTLAKRLEIRPGDPLELRVILGIGDQLTGDDDGIGKYTLTTRGIVTGTFVAPEAVFVDRDFLAEELGEPGSATLVALHTKSHDDLGRLARRLGAGLPDIEVKTWEEDSTFAAQAIKSSDVLAGISRAMVALAVIVPVWALLYIHVLHRQRDIAILAAVGLAPGELFRIYLVQALLVGLAGGMIGAGFGYGLVRWFDAHPIFTMDIFVIRPRVTAGTFVWPVLLVLSATLAASLLPAWRAARTDPAPILRERAT